MNRILLSASAAIALCAIPASAETEFGGVMRAVNQTTDTGGEYYTDFGLHVGGDAGRFFALRENRESSVGWGNSFGNSWVGVSYNITTDVTKIAAKHDINEFSFGGEAKTNDEWNVWARYENDTYLVGAKYNQNDVVGILAGYKSNGLKAVAEVKSNDEWSIGLGYEQGDYSVYAGYEWDEDYKFEANYKLTENFTLQGAYVLEDAGATERVKAGISFAF